MSILINVSSLLSGFPDSPVGLKKKKKNPPTMQETLVGSLGWEDMLEKGKAIHSSVLAWRFPQTV